MSSAASDVLGSVTATEGHFRFESGYHGGTWLDLEGLFLRPSGLMGRIRELSARLSAHNLDAVCGPITGGAFVAVLVAVDLDLDFYHSEQVAAVANDELWPSGIGSRTRSDLVSAASASGS